jgi:phthiocerol/phenolphthiocerol synthesis type-I polyketide synthase E
VVAADVADEAAMRAAVHQARERFGPIQAAIHAAGVPGGGVIQLKTAEAAERVLAPKLQGTRALAAALAGEPLDILVLCSSTFGVTGGVGQVDYCAANSFLDAFARHHSARGTRTVAIGWGAWQEVGMAAEASGTARTSPAAIPAAMPAAAPAPPLPDRSGTELHPLLERREEGPDGAVAYAGELSPARHWVLAEHAVAGAPTVPGTTYLEMARAAWALETGTPEVEIRDVTFVSPLLVPNGARQVRVVLAAGNGGKPFHIESRMGADGAWQEHARGVLYPLAAPAPPQDLAAIAVRCTMGDHAAEALEAFTAGNSLVFWGPRWHSLRRARIGTDEALVELELPPGFAADLESFGLHPALLDVATAFGGGMLSGGRMLPASYGRVRYRAPLPAAFLAHLHSPRRAEGDEALTLDLTLMSPDGEVLVEIGDFVMHRVAEGGRRPVTALAAKDAKAVAALAGRGSADWILPAEGVEAFRRILSRGRFAQVAVSPLDLNLTIASMRRRAEERSIAEPAAREAFPRPNLETAYVPPATATEATLAGIWQGVLGLEQIGTRDNFFDLGGDSVIGIQIVARAIAGGVQFSPEQLFEHQTIAELAAWLDLQAAAAPLPETEIPTVAAADVAPDIADDLSSTELDKIFSQLTGMP